MPCNSGKWSARTILALLALVFLPGCSLILGEEADNPMAYNPYGAMALMTANVIGFTYRAIADGEVTGVALKGEPLATSERVPCFIDPASVELTYVYSIRSKKTFDEEIVWRRGAYRVLTAREVHSGKVTAPFPLEQVRQDLGNNWPGLWTLTLEVKGEPRGEMSFRLASRETRNALLQEAEAFRVAGAMDLYRRLRDRAKACWPEPL